MASESNNGMRRHGQYRTPEYKAWSAMKARCYNPNDKRFPRYGGRGITVCERWRDSYENFIADMGPRPSDSHSLDRINNDGNYEPSNCRWATIQEQNLNYRRNVRLTFEGRTLTMSEWAEVTGLPQETIRKRIRRGWPVDATLTTPGDRSSGCRMRDTLNKAGRIG